MEIWIGTEKISQSICEQKIEKIKEKLTEEGSCSGRVVVSRSKSQLGSVLQYLACRESGAVPLFVAPDFPIETSYAMDACGINCIMEGDEKGNTEVLLLDNPKRNVDSSFAPGSIIQMTSATTGRPKLVLRTREKLKAEIRAYLEKTGYKKGSKFLSMAPFFHAYAFSCVLLTCIELEGCLILPDLVLPRRVIQLCEYHNVQHLYGIPYFFEMMTKVKNFNSLGENIETVMSTAQVVSIELAETFKNKFDISISTQYGSTETGCMAIGKVLEDKGFQYPLKGIIPHLVKDEAERNHLYIDCPDVLGEYVDENGIHSIGDDEWYDTKDIAQENKEGGIRILGRSDDILIRAGEKIDAKRVASILEELPEIKKARVILDKKSNLLMCLYSGEKNLDISKVREYCKKQISEYQIPQHFEWSEEMENRKESWKEKGK